MTCPTCSSPAPHRHPAVSCGGEVELCCDDFHLTATPQNRQRDIDAVLAKRACKALQPPKRRREAMSGIDEVQLHHRVRTACEQAGSPTQLARDLNLCPEQVRMFLRHKRPAEPKLLAALGLRRVVTYQETGDAPKGTNCVSAALGEEGEG